MLDHFVYRAGDAIVGFGGLYRHDLEMGREWLNWFGVDPGHRGMGYGVRIIEHLVHLAQRRGAATVVGYTEDGEDNLSTQHFYEKLGFRATVLYSFRGEEVRLYEKHIRTTTAAE